MSFTASNPIQFFSVVGPAYVAENHDGLGHLPARSEREQIRVGVTTLWVSLFATFGVSLIGAGHAAKAVWIDTPTLH
jgi:hypothetical protein